MTSNILLLTLSLFISSSLQKCAYRVLDNGKPIKVDEQPHIVQGSTMCTQYNGKLGCCNANNDASQIVSYVELDGVFSNQGGGCDICAINLKRLWCEYACSLRQQDFMKVTEEYYPVPDPKKPDETVMVQKVKLTVNADSACSMYNSCKRVPFVSSVSAMSSPAGFLNFQGHNAVDDAFQWIDMDFSYNTNDSLYFNDVRKQTEPERAALTMCNYTGQSPLHGFVISKNCSCNNCEDSCDSSSGFVYSEPKVFQDFNWTLVVVVWAGCIFGVGLVTFLRSRKSQSEKYKQG